MNRGALDQLDRILYILPRAAGEGGASITELAKELEVTPERITADIHEVLARAYYHPASAGSAIRASFAGDRLEVFTTGEFQRPTRLSGREALAVALALRMRVADGAAQALEVTHLRRLTTALEAQVGEDSPAPSSIDQIHLESIDPRDQIRDVIMDAHHQRRRCRIRYLSGARSEPTERTAHPYALAHGDGSWYVVGHCELRDEIRTFRFDQVIEAGLLEDQFEIPPDFDVGDFTEDGQVHDGSFSDDVEVVYSPGIARWVRERWVGEGLPEGAYVVRHQISNARWLTQHIMGYGGEAEVVDPRRYRDVVADVARRVADGDGGADKRFS
jgi:proteasome accessory factor C